MSTVHDLFQQIQALPDGQRQELFEMLHRAPTADPPADDGPVEDFVYDPKNPMLGLFHDEPEVMDEVMRLVYEARQNRAWRTFDE